jgi:hypothetical protein
MLNYFNSNLFFFVIYVNDVQLIVSIFQLSLFQIEMLITVKTFCIIKNHI